MSTADACGFTFTLAVNESDRYTAEVQDYDLYTEVQLTSIQILAKDHGDSSIATTL